MTTGNIQRSRLIGDKVGLRWTPANYTPATVSGYSDNSDQLTSHLKGIDTKFSTVASVVSVTVTAAETVAQYDAVYIDTSVGQIRKCISNQTISVANFFGIVTQSGGISSSSSGSVVINGAVTNGSWTWTPFLQVYVGSTVGTLTQTAPTVKGQYVVPVGVATSATTIQINPITGWELTEGSLAHGVAKLGFDNTNLISTILTPPANSIITQVSVDVKVAAGGAGATISVGSTSNPIADITTAQVDLTVLGKNTFRPYNDVGASPESRILTVSNGGRTFSGVVYVFYEIPDQLTGHSGTSKLVFSNSTPTSPYTLFSPPNNAIITEVTCIVIGNASGGSPTISVGIVGNTGRDFRTTDSNLKALGTYTYTPFTDCGSSPAPIIVTIVSNGQTFNGKLYVKYVVPD